MEDMTPATDHAALLAQCDQILAQAHQVLVERGQNYADIRDNSKAFATILRLFGFVPPAGMTDTTWHCLSNIATKMARMSAGDLTHEDTMVDSANYWVLMLAAMRLANGQNAPVPAPTPAPIPAPPPIAPVIITGPLPVTPEPVMVTPDPTLDQPVPATVTPIITPPPVIPSAPPTPPTLPAPEPSVPPAVQLGVTAPEHHEEPLVLEPAWVVPGPGTDRPAWVPTPGRQTTV